MKLQFQWSYLINIWIFAGLGLILGWQINLPTSLDSSFYLEIASSLLRYAVFPFLFVSATLAVFQHLKNKTFKPLLARYLFFHLAVLGLLLMFNSLWFFLPKRQIPLQSTSISVPELPSLFEYWLSIIPSNFFFLWNQNTFLGLFAFSVFLGVLLFNTQKTSQAFVILLDSASHLFYQANRYIAKLSLPLTGIFSFFFVQTLKNNPIRPALWWVLLEVSGFVLIFYSLYLLCLRYVFHIRVWPFMKSSASLLFLSFFYPESWAIANRMVVDSHEKLRISSQTYSLGISALSLFSKVGIAFMASFVFFIVMRSYSYLSPSPWVILWTTGITYLLASLLGDRTPWSLLSALSLLFLWYGNGLENSFLIVAPILPILQGLTHVLNTHHILCVNTILEKKLIKTPITY